MIENQYSGMMEGGVFLDSPKPFILMGWPVHGRVKTFDTEDEAQCFLEAESLTDPHIRFAPLYGFSDGKWHRLHQSRSEAISSKVQT
jgi:hypothetical protein